MIILEKQSKFTVKHFLKDTQIHEDSSTSDSSNE